MINNSANERMGKVSPKEKTRRVKGRRQSRSSGNKYLIRPGTLTQLRCSKPLGSTSAVGKCYCTDLREEEGGGVACHEESNGA